MATNNAWNSQNPAQVERGGTGQVSLTNHNVLVGNDIGAVSLIAPSHTAGAPLISLGINHNPAFGPATVPGGGTGMTELAPIYTVLCGGTTQVSSLQNVVNTGTLEQFLTSNGPNQLPTWQDAVGTNYGVLVGCDGEDTDIRGTTYLEATNIYYDPFHCWDMINSYYVTAVHGIYFFCVHLEVLSALPFPIHGLPSDPSVYYNQTCRLETIFPSGQSTTEVVDFAYRPSSINSYQNIQYSMDAVCIFEADQNTNVRFGIVYGPFFDSPSTWWSFLKINGPQDGFITSYITGCLLKPL